MRPSSVKMATDQVAILMQAKFSGRAAKDKRRIIQRHALIIEILYKRWQIGIFQLKAKHCQWFMQHYLREHTPGTQYQYWLRLREILVAIDKINDWEPLLRGPWRNPKGEPYRVSSRGRKPKFVGHSSSVPKKKDSAVRRYVQGK